MSDIRRNKTLFKWDNFFAGLWPMTAVQAIYFQNITHSYVAAMSVFSVCALSQAVLEIPTGIFSDKIGRRQTLILSVSAILICLLLWAMAGQFLCVPLLFVGAVLYGASDALMSGTLEALMFETMREIGEEKEFKQIYARSRVYNQIGLLLSILIASAVLYFRSMQFLAWMSVLPMTGQLAVSFFYVNPEREQKAEKHNFKRAFLSLWKNKKLRRFGAIEILDSSFGMTIGRFEGVYFENLIAVWAVNLVRGCKQVSGMVGYMVAARLKRIKTIRQLLAAVSGSFIFEAAGLLLNRIGTPFVMAFSYFFSAIAETSKTELLQSEYSSAERATMGSVLSLITAVSQAFFCALAGFWADCFGVRVALGCVVVARLTVVFMCCEKRV